MMRVVAFLTPYLGVLSILMAPVVSYSTVMHENAKRIEHSSPLDSLPASIEPDKYPKFWSESAVLGPCTPTKEYVREWHGVPYVGSGDDGYVKLKDRTSLIRTCGLPYQ